jgi:hypothetical protein
MHHLSLRHSSLSMLCMIAAVRVFFYSAAFPFFNNVDEVAHADLVIKYSRLEIPRTTMTISRETASMMVLYASSEFFTTPEQFGGRFPVPRWKQPNGQLNSGDEPAIKTICAIPNHESLEPPLYYAAAGLWLKAGRPFFTNGISQLYWIRFLNVILAVLLVVLTYKCAVEIFGADILAVYAITGLAAMFPQDTFYSIQSDVLSPVVYGFVFLYGIRLIKSTVPSARLTMSLGLAAAATLLTKLTNMPVLILVNGLVIVKIYRLHRIKHLVHAKPAFIKFFICAWIPVILLLLWNYLNTGTLTASQSKMDFLTWTNKPAGAWLDNSLFTVHGIIFFWTSIIATFWRGEIIFYQNALHDPAVDGFYWLSTVIFFAASFVKRGDLNSSIIKVFTALSFLFLLLNLMFISLIFDYGQCGNPSQQYPFFCSGRLLSAALIPFLFLYVSGFKFLFSWIANKRYRYLLFWMLIGLVTLSEIMISIPVFKSQYNFLHL